MASEPREREQDERHVPELVKKLRARRDSYRQRGKAVRAVYVLVGFTLTLAGLAMLLLPGPAFIVIPIGLAILSLEFAWAENLLEKAIERGDVAKRKAAEATRTQKILSGIATALGIAAAVAAVLLWDIPLLPDS